MGFTAEKITELFNLLTDPNGVGFPILIGAGLGIILYLMNYTGKEWQKSDARIKESKDTNTRIGFPHQPF